MSVLLEGGFWDRRENILAFGNPGSGKTHLLCALGQELIYQGRRVLFRPWSLLVQERLLAKQELSLPRLLRRLSKYEALIIDDLGDVQQSPEAMEVLFVLLAQRYERGALPYADYDDATPAVRRRTALLGITTPACRLRWIARCETT